MMHCWLSAEEAVAGIRVPQSGLGRGLWTRTVTLDTLVLLLPFPNMCAFGLGWLLT